MAEFDNLDISIDICPICISEYVRTNGSWCYRAVEGVGEESRRLDMRVSRDPFRYFWPNSHSQNHLTVQILQLLAGASGGRSMSVHISWKKGQQSWCDQCRQR